MSLLKNRFGCSLSDWIDYISSIHYKSIDMSLERIRSVANRMGVLNFKSIKITVGGTNGKGSTCAYLEQILIAQGYTVGLYISPHIISYNERARINGIPVSEDLFISHFLEVEKYRKTIPLTEFEFGTLAVLSLFQAFNLDVIILEVGLGGRLDATNIVDSNCACITNIDLDHTDRLGTTKEKIAFEKAHIYRSGCPAIFGDVAHLESVEYYSQYINANLIKRGRDFSYNSEKDSWNFNGLHYQYNYLPNPIMFGSHQLLNASLALATLESLRKLLPISFKSICTGLLNAKLPGRFQIINKIGWPIIVLDVAHNVHAAFELSKNLECMGKFNKTYGIIGILKDKDVVGIVAHMQEHIDEWLCVNLSGPRNRCLDEFAELLENQLFMKKQIGKKVSKFSSPTHAIEKCLAHSNKHDRIVVFGSFLTVSEILSKISC